MKVDPKNCVIFEDSTACIKGALVFGAKVVGINVSEADRKSYNLGFTVKDLSEVSVMFYRDIMKISCVLCTYKKDMVFFSTKKKSRSTPAL